MFADSFFHLKNLLIVHLINIYVLGWVLKLMDPRYLVLRSSSMTQLTSKRIISSFDLIISIFNLFIWIAYLTHFITKLGCFLRLVFYGFIKSCNLSFDILFLLLKIVHHIKKLVLKFFVSLCFDYVGNLVLLSFQSDDFLSIIRFDRFDWCNFFFYRYGG